MPAFLSSMREVSAAHAIVHGFVGLEETETIRRRFVERLKSESTRRFWDRSQVEELASFLRCTADCISNDKVLLLSSNDYYIGAALVNAKIVLCNAISGWRIVKNDLCLLTMNITDGLCLEINYYNNDGVRDGIYELTVWGEFGCALSN
jgi:hypothetical protein